MELSTPPRLSAAGQLVSSRLELDQLAGALRVAFQELSVISRGAAVASEIAGTILTASTSPRVSWMLRRLSAPLPMPGPRTDSIARTFEPDLIALVTSQE